MTPNCPINVREYRRAITNMQSRETGNIAYTRRRLFYSCRVLFLLTIVLYVIRITTSNYNFDIFKPFFILLKLIQNKKKQCRA